MLLYHNEKQLICLTNKCAFPQWASWFIHLVHKLLQQTFTTDLDHGYDRITKWSELLQYKQSGSNSYYELAQSWNHRSPTIEKLCLPLLQKGDAAESSRMDELLILPHHQDLSLNVRDKVQETLFDKPCHERLDAQMKQRLAPCEKGDSEVEVSARPWFLPARPHHLIPWVDPSLPILAQSKAGLELVQMLSGLKCCQDWTAHRRKPSCWAPSPAVPLCLAPFVGWQLHAELLSCIQKALPNSWCLASTTTASFWAANRYAKQGGYCLPDFCLLFPSLVCDSFWLIPSRKKNMGQRCSK